MKSSTFATLAGLVLALILLWLAMQGFNVVRWRIRYLMPAFLSGLVVGVLATLALTGGRRG
ncbi:MULTISPECIES: hypothetical protein [unclassified Luteococcus]|uniref:hypothetical protein n=1 Tax=unclassified Luteococcus TaxID=2639923 RepID=UPI00313BAE63